MNGHDWIIHDGHYYCLNSFNGNESNSSIAIRMSLDDEKVGKRNSRKEILSRPPIVVEHVPPIPITFDPANIFPKKGLPVRCNANSKTGNSKENKSTSKQKLRKPSISGVIPPLSSSELTSSAESGDQYESGVLAVDKILLRELNAFAGPYRIYERNHPAANSALRSNTSAIRQQQSQGSSNGNSFAKLVNNEDPNQIHKIVQAYYLCDLTRESMVELYGIISNWNTGPLSLESYLQLLTKDFQDPFIRSWAVAHLESASDTQLENVMLQLVHLIRYEPYPDSAKLMPKSKNYENIKSGCKILDNVSLPRFLLRRFDSFLQKLNH